MKSPARFPVWRGNPGRATSGEERHPPPARQFGMWIRRRRHILGKTPEDTAMEAGLPTAWWQKLEAGHLPLEDIWLHLPDIAYALGLKTGHVLRVLLTCLEPPSRNMGTQGP